MKGELDITDIKKGLNVLIDKYNQLKNEMGEKGLKAISEANVRKDFIDPLFEILGWNVRDSHEYDAEKYIRGVGFADVAIKVNETPIVFIEAKRFGNIPSYEERNVQTTLSGQKIIADWTDEERQVLHYAGGIIKADWALLTNFQKFRFFNANVGKVVLNIEKPEEYLEKFDELFLLTKRNVENKNIEKLATRVVKPDVDLDFLNLLNDWRLKLAIDMYKTNETLGLEDIKKYVQRILDRLILIRYAEDKWILENPDQLKSAYDYWLKTKAYSKLTETLKNLFYGFDRVHNSKIFEKDENLDQIIDKMSNSVVGEVINELYNQSFRKFTTEILGSTYESYLGHELLLEKDRTITILPNQQIRKAGGIYYTPKCVVDFIVENTVGKKLDEIWDEINQLLNEKKYGAAIQKYKVISQLRILDPACGSGTFLISAFSSMKKVFENYNKKIDEIKKGILREIARSQGNQLTLKVEIPQPISGFEQKILEENIFGVDLDSAATEITVVNLIFHALKKKELLPKILDENIRNGNSIISGRIKELETFFDKPLKKKPFDWTEEFSSIFNKGGFDFVIGNPPYVNMQTMPEEQKYCEAFYPEIYTGQNDLLYYFVVKGLEVLKNNGTLGYITARYFLESSYASKFREYLLNNSCIKQIIDFKNVQLFAGVNLKTNKKMNINVLTTIVILEKEETEERRKKNKIKVVKVNAWEGKVESLFVHITENISKDEYFDNHIEVFTIDQSTLDSNIWSLTPLSVTNLLEKANENSLKLGKLCDLGHGMTTGLNKIFHLTEKKIREYNIERELLRPFVKNQDIKRYGVNYKSRFLLYTTKELDISKYPNTLKYLASYDELEKRHSFKSNTCDWFSISVERNRELFENAKEKLIVPSYSTTNRFAYDDKFYLGMTDVYIIVPKENCPVDLKYILAILNSKLIEFYHKNTAKLKRDGYFEYVEKPLSNIPIYNINFQNKHEKETYNKILELVEQIITLYNTQLMTIDVFRKILKNKLDKTSEYVEFGTNYYQQGSKYGIDLEKSEFLVDKSTEGRAIYLTIKEENNFLIIKGKYISKGTEHFQDLIKIYVENNSLRKYFYYSILSFLVNNPKKRNWGSGNVVEGVLKTLKIPRFVQNIKRNLEKINEFMSEFFSKSPIGDQSLTVVEKGIEANDKEIDEIIYQLYGVSETEKEFIEENVDSHIRRIYEGCFPH